MEIPKYIVFRVDVMRKGTSVELTNITDEVEDVIFEADRKTEPMMTNLEWIRTLSEEELADWFYDEWLHHLQYRWSSSRGGLIIWLKDRKTESNSEFPNNSTTEDCSTVEGEPQTFDKPTKCLGCLYSDLDKAFHPCASCVDFGKYVGEVSGKVEPQTEMTTEQVVNELLSIKQILDDGKMPKQRCGNCKHLTYRWNKTWCDIKCDNPHDMVCDKWERSE